MKERKPKKIFVEGPIATERIARSVADHQVKTNIGAHGIFLGQVRADLVGDRTVAAIRYSAYEEMAEEVVHDIREQAFELFDLTCAHIYHSLGEVKAGELCLFVFTSSRHRHTAFEATRFLVEEIKAKAPIFGKEIFADNTSQWKVNT